MPSPHSIRVRYSLRDRDLDRFPQDDEALGRRCTTTISDAMVRGVPPPVLFVLYPDRVELLDLVPVIEDHHPIHVFIAAASSQPGVEAVALLAVLDLKRQGRVVGHSAVAFLEWPDCRWWMSAQNLDAQLLRTDEKPTIRRAVDGMPRPTGLGGWFTHGRYHRLRFELNTQPPVESEPMVH